MSCTEFTAGDRQRRRMHFQRSLQGITTRNTQSMQRNAANAATVDEAEEAEEASINDAEKHRPLYQSIGGTLKTKAAMKYQILIGPLDFQQEIINKLKPTYKCAEGLILEAACCYH